MMYIKAKEPESVKKSESRIKRVIRFCFQLVLPKANPDFEDKIKLVAYWLLEFKDKSSVPNREIGLGINEDVILKMPYKKNFGYWVDNSLTCEDFQKTFEVEEITKEYFDEKWKVEW
jgi:hypothetical protein